MHIVHWGLRMDADRDGNGGILSPSLTTVEEEGHEDEDCGKQHAQSDAGGQYYDQIVLIRSPHADRHLEVYGCVSLCDCVRYRVAHQR